MTLTKSDPVTAGLIDIHEVLGSDLPSSERERAGLLWFALARLQEPLRQRTDPLTTPTGPESEVDHSRQTLHRRHEKLRQEHHNLLERCIALKWELYSAAQPFSPPQEMLGKTPPLRQSGEPDFLALYEEIHGFAEDLAHLNQEIDALVLESISTDIGAGD